jgi:hypothetical protein
LNSPSGNDVVIFDDDSLLIDVSANDTVALLIYDNEQLIFSDTVEEAVFYHHPATIGNHLLRFEASTDTTVSLEEKYLWQSAILAN